MSLRIFANYEAKESSKKNTKLKYIDKVCFNNQNPYSLIPNTYYFQIKHIYLLHSMKSGTQTWAVFICFKIWNIVFFLLDKQLPTIKQLEM